MVWIDLGLPHDPVQASMYHVKYSEGLEQDGLCFSLHSSVSLSGAV